MNQTERLRRLISNAGITQKQAALYIAQETKRPFSLRTLSAWLADDSIQNKRAAQKWGADALEARLRLKKELEQHAWYTHMCVAIHLVLHYINQLANLFRLLLKVQAKAMLGVIAFKSFSGNSVGSYLAWAWPALAGFIFCASVVMIRRWIRTVSFQIHRLMGIENTLDKDKSMFASAKNILPATQCNILGLKMP
jgi:hypothetical protein